jgi:hypothetical protein
MTLSERQNGACGAIDDDTVELHAMGRLEVHSVIQHLDSCEVCKERVAEHRSWIEALRQGLQEFEPTSKAKGGTNCASPPHDM